MAEEEKTDRDKRDDIHDVITASAANIGADDWKGGRSHPTPEGFGLCSSCKNFRYVTSEYRIRLAQCGYYSNNNQTVNLSESDPVKSCTSHDQVGLLTLWEMLGMATLIEPPPRKIGFGRKENEDK